MDLTDNIWLEKVKLKYLLFSLICLGYFAYGCNITIMGIAFADLTAILDVDSKNVSYGITIRFIINCFSAILAGFSFQVFSRQILYTISLVIYGLFMIILPLYQNLIIYFVSSAVIGLVSAFIDCVTNLWVFELFPKNVSFHVLVVHFSYSMGQTVAPQIIRPFLSNQTFINNTDTSLSNKLIRESTRIDTPFLICGLIFIIVAFFVFLCYLFKPYVPPKRTIESKDIIEIDKVFKENETIEANSNFEIDKKNPKETIKKSPLPSYYYNSFIIITSLILAFEVANELNLNYYLPVYLNKSHLQINQDTTAYMMSLIGIAYCVGRLLNVLILIKVDVLIILYFNLSLIVMGNLVLTFLATNKEIYITWIAISLLGLGYSSTFPCLFSFIEQRITVTNALNSFLVFVTSSGFTINSLLIGNSIDENPSLFQYLNSIYSALFLIFFGMLHSTDLWKKNILKKLNL